MRDRAQQMSLTVGLGAWALIVALGLPSLWAPAPQVELRMYDQGQRSDVIVACQYKDGTSVNRGFQLPAMMPVEKPFRRCMVMKAADDKFTVTTELVVDGAVSARYQASTEYGQVRFDRRGGVR